MNAKRVPTRAERGQAMDAFLVQAGWVGATRRMLAGDASFRRYERVEWHGRHAVLMDAPPPWEDVAPFVRVTEQLAACGVRVPQIIAADRAQGFLLLEDLGDASFTRLLKDQPAREAELYLAATEALLVLARASATQRPELPAYDMAVYRREAGLFAEWFLPQLHGIEQARTLRADWLSCWEAVLANAGLKQQCLVHRDYHADNLLWLEGAAGIDAVAMLDYQDALWGDAAYDLASLLEDARRDVSADTVRRCWQHYLQASGEPEAHFTRRYAVLAAQRNAKIIGIFVRLCVRDGKAHYLDYLPRVWGHFMRDLAHPALAPVRAFVDAHVPVAWRGDFSADVSIGGIAP